MANQRRHGTTDEIPAIRLQQELPLFLPLPHIEHDGLREPVSERPVPLESLQHPLSVYQELLEVMHVSAA